MTIARNIVAYNVPLDDLAGITILAGADYDLSLEPAEAVTNSVDLITAINADEIILLAADNTTPLTKAESLGAATQTDNDRYVGVSAVDTTPDYLNAKIVAGTNVSVAVLNPGANETLQISATGGGGADEKVGVSIDDTTPSYLEDKIAAGTGISLSTLLPAGNEQLEIAVNLNVEQLNNVVITAPADNEVLAWNNGTSNWINQTAAEAGLATALDLTTHTGDGTIHFTEASIDHTAITNIGTNSHAAIDTHIADGTLHFTKSSILIDDLGDVVITTPADNEVLAFDTTSGNFINQTPAEAGLSEVGHGHASSEITIPIITGATFTTVEEGLSTFHSTGKIVGGAITDNGDGSITVAAGTGYVRLSTDSTSTLYSVDWPETILSGFPLKQDSFVEMHIVAGVPTVYFTSPRPSCDTNIHLGIVWNDGGNVLFINRVIGFNVGDHARLMINRLQDTAPYARVSGAIISQTGTRNLAVTAGNFWEGLQEYVTSAIDTSATGTFGAIYSDGIGGWTIDYGQTQFSNTQYDDGDGTLGNLTPGNYGVHWAYLETNGGLFLHYGVGDYSLVQAQEAALPPSIHPGIPNHAKIIGKIIVQQGAASAISVESAFLQTFTASAATDHNDLINIGTNSHTQIDSHIASTANPHSTTLANLTDTTIATPLDGQFITYDNATSKWINEAPARIAQVSATDTTPGYLGTEIVAGSGIQLNILNPGADEKLEIVNLASTPNIWATFNADTGTTTANTSADTLTVSGGPGISTSITGDVLTVAPSNDLAALEALAGTGFAVRTAADTWAQRTITGTTDQITVADGDGVATNPIIAIANNPIIPGTEGIQIPSGTTAQRPLAPAIGDMRFNTTTGLYEAWNGTVWVSFGANPGSSVSELKFGQLAQLSGTTTIPYDDTPPLITEGTQFFSDTMTVGTTNGRVVLWFSSTCSVSNSNRLITVSLWRDTTLIGIFAIGAPSSNSPVIATGIIADVPGAAGTYTYSGRIGLSASATWYIGGFTPNATYGGAANTNNQYVLMRLE